MNLRFVIRWVVFGALFVALVNAAIGLTQAKRTESQFQAVLIHRYKEQLQQATEVLRNELLQGDIRGARLRLEALRAAHEIVGYRIVQADQKPEDSANYEEIANAEGVIEVPSVVGFSEGGAKWGEVRYQVSLTELKSLSRSLFRSVLLTGIVTIGLSLFGFFLFAQFLLVASRELYPLLERISRDQSPGYIGQFASRIWAPLIEVLSEAAIRLGRLQEANINAQKSKAMGEQAIQVAHDIRSPLAALKSVIQNAQGLDEANRAQVRLATHRIHDIANDLLARNRANLGQSWSARLDSHADIAAVSSEPRLVDLLSSVIDSGVSEKRIQFSEESGVEIFFEASHNSFGLFAEIQPTEFYRMISNIINNSVEAFEGAGKVEVFLERNGDWASIRIVDNGKGIPAELLSKVVERGGTFGKKDGNGLGLSHAKATVESWGGKFKLESTVGQGTTVTLELPLVEPPRWFASEIAVARGMTIVIADDDLSVHELWARRLGKLEFQPKIVNLHAPKDLLTWYRENLLAENVLYLCDYEFAGSDQSGLDVIDATGIAPQSILVTNRWEQTPVRSRCEKLGLRILPKSLAPIVRLR